MIPGQIVNYKMEEVKVFCMGVTCVVMGSPEFLNRDTSIFIEFGIIHVNMFKAPIGMFAFQNSLNYIWLR